MKIQRHRPETFSGQDGDDAKPRPGPGPDPSAGYERYERRGHEPGQDGQDWLRAEREILLRRSCCYNNY